jgi:hypothetical protein
MDVMKQILYLLGLFLIMVPYSCNQEISPEQADKFIKFYGNSLVDQASDMEVMDDGSYVICGVDSVAGQGKRAVLIITDEFGNVKEGFPKYYADGDNNTEANALLLKGGGEGGFLLVGHTEKQVAGTIPLIYQKDIFLVRVSKSGQELWKKSYGSAEDESVLHATEMINSGGFILVGYQVQKGKKDIMVMGVTDNGDSIRLGLNYNNPQADNAAVNYILNTGDQYLCVCTYNKIGTDGTDILILNFDDELSPNDKALGDNFDELGQCIMEDGVDRYLVLGNRLNLAGYSEIILYLIETNGLLITTSFPINPISEANANLVAHRFVKTENGRIAIVGTRIAGGNRDIFLQFLESDYQEAERIIYGSAGNQSGADIEIPGSDGFVILGTNGERRSSMITLIKTGDAGDL